MKNYLKIHELLQDFYLVRRQVRAQYQVGSLGISECQLLVQLLAEPEINATRMAETLSVAKSTISRILKGLINKELIITNICKNDGRSRSLEVTELGEEMVRQLQLSESEVLRRCLGHLSARQVSDLTYYLRTLADGWGTSEQTGLPGDHPVTVEITRLGRATGMTGSKFLNSNISSTEYIVLKSLSLSDSTSSVSALDRLLPFDKSTLSRTVNRLVKQDIILKNGGLGRKGSKLKISDSGLSLLHEVEANATNAIKLALANKNEQFVDHFVELLKLLSNPDAIQTSILRERTDVKELATVSERLQARGLLIDYLVSNNLHYESCDECFSAAGHSYGLYVSNRLKAVCQIFPHGAKYCLDNFAYQIGVEEQLIVDFLRFVLNEASRKLESTKLYINTHRLSQQVTGKLNIKKDGRDNPYIDTSAADALQEENEKMKKSETAEAQLPAAIAGKN